MTYPPVAPVRIFIGGQELEGWTTFNLTRDKQNLTGNFSVQLFFSYVPDQPVLAQAVRGADCAIYVGGHLALFGSLDRRQGSDAPRKGDGFKIARQAQITKSSYTVTLTGRGQTKRLANSSQDHPTSTELGAKTKRATQKLIENFGVVLDWRGEDLDMDKIRFRDGIVVSDELRRIAAEYGYHMFETRDGRLRVTDRSGPETGEALVLGDNILEFSASQDEESANSSVKVKGQRTVKKIRGRAAVQREKVFADKWVGNYSPLIVQHFTDASDKALERRGRFELDQLAAQAKDVTVKVFHVQSRTGAPWDIGQLHEVIVPPEGLADIMECTRLVYNVSARGELTTTLTLNPPRSAAATATPGAALANVAAGGALNTAASGGALNTAASDGRYPDNWSSAEIVTNFDLGNSGVDGIAVDRAKPIPPLRLPSNL